MLDIASNRVDKCPAEISSWTKMKTINLARNKLTSFPAGIYDMKDLTHLNISGNRIAGLTPLIYLTFTRSFDGGFTQNECRLLFVRETL